MVFVMSGEINCLIELVNGVYDNLLVWEMDVLVFIGE